MSFRWLALLLLASALPGCGQKRGGAGAPSASARVVLPPLTAPSWIADLVVPGFGAAKVSLPLGARSPRPVVVAIHGDADRPEWSCGSYRHATAARSFVLCPRGAPRAGAEGFTLGAPEDTAAELRAALRALKLRYGAHVAKDGLVLAGVGPGVEHAIEIAREEPSFFSRLVLLDGPLRRLGLGAVSLYAKRGGKRVLVACSAACDPEVEAKVLALRSAGVEARLVRDGAALGLDAKRTESLRGAWPWLVGGEPRWQ